MKLRIEISPEESEEIVIRCHERTENVKKLESVIENLINADAECVLYIGETEYFVPYKKILFSRRARERFTPTPKKKCSFATQLLASLKMFCPTILLEAPNPA